MQGKGQVTTGADQVRTEERNPRTLDIDQLSTRQLLERLNDEDATVPAAVAAALPKLAVAVDWVVDALRAGGRLHYFGAGSSGRIAVLDAAEVPPTFGLSAGSIVAHPAGGQDAMQVALEGVEDDERLGLASAADVGPADVAVGITASGRTPYVAGALRAAKAAGARTVLVSSNPAAPVASLADLCVITDTGPEAIAGSTRLKAATAHKLVLNSLSTAAMVRLGMTYSNLMVAVQGLNSKLRLRQVRILSEASGFSADRCATELTRCDGDLRLALASLVSGRPVGEVAQALDSVQGNVRQALALLGEDESR